METLKPVKGSVNDLNLFDQKNLPKAPDKLSQIAEKALQHFSMSTKDDAGAEASFSVSDLTRDERVIVRDKIKAVKPEWNIAIVTSSWDMIFQADLELISRTRVKPALKQDRMQEIADEILKEMRGGAVRYRIPLNDYDEKMELIKWLKEKKPHWQISLVEECIFGGSKRVPGKMLDVLVVTAKLDAEEQKINLEHAAKNVLEYLTSLLGVKDGRIWADVSELTREERVMLRDKMKELKPEWNLIITKESKDTKNIPVKLELASPLQALEPGKEFWEQIAESLEKRLNGGTSSYDVTNLDYDKQLELLAWLKEKRPHWQANIAEQNPYSGVLVTRFFPGKMSDILTVTASASA